MVGVGGVPYHGGTCNTNPYVRTYLSHFKESSKVAILLFKTSQGKVTAQGWFKASGNSLSKPELTAADRISSGRTLPDLIMILKETSSCPEMLSDDRKS